MSETTDTQYCTPPEVLCEMCEQLKRELTEARDQLEGAGKLMTACDVLVRELAEARQQRDALINILTDVINDDGTAKSIDRAAIFLTAVKGGSDE